MEKSNLDNKSKKNQDNEETILVWLESGPYPYTNLGIVSALSKLGKFNFIGIINSKQDISFLQKQNFVQFKKLLYYPDCYIGKSTFNLNNIKKIEEQFDLKLWLDIFTDRTWFYKFHTNFHKFTYKEILTITENSLLFFIDVLEKYHPKILIMQRAGENFSNLLLYRLAKKMNIKVLMPIDLHLKNHIHISDNLTGDEISNDFIKLREDFSDSIEKYDKEFLKSNNFTEILEIIASFDSGIGSLPQKIKHYFKRLSNNLEPVYINTGKTKINLLKYRWSNYFETKKREQFLDNNAIKIIEDDKFLYFPLQSEPEAAILVNTPFYNNQLSLIETIAKSIPINFTLYVKEHPLQKEKSWRPIQVYKDIINIPNVKFLHPDVDAQKLLEKSQGVITISGATGFEALFYKKPVILFGDEDYDKLSMITKIKTINDLPKKIASALTNFKFDEREFGIFMAVFKKHALPIPYYSMMKEGVYLSSIQRNKQEFDSTNLYFQKFYEKYENDFKLIASAIFSRLQKNNILK